MRKLMFVLFAGMILVLAGCLKTDTPAADCTPPSAAAPTNEVDALQAYLNTNGIVATQDKRGFFYTIDSSASTTPGFPTRCSYLTVAYVGKLTSGTTFDSAGVANPVSFSLSNTILGWQEAIPKMKINSSMNLYIPPSLGYGSTAQGPIPANSTLIFTIKLIGFN